MTTKCILHIGFLMPSGHGQVRREGKTWLAHRWAFYQANGYLPEVVRHSCDNPQCINPEHLLAGDQIDNMRDMHERKRGHRNGTVLTSEQIAEIKEALKTPYRGQGRTLAAKYGVSPQLITNIKKGRNRCVT